MSRVNLILETDHDASSSQEQRGIGIPKKADGTMQVIRRIRSSTRAPPIRIRFMRVPATGTNESSRKRAPRPTTTSK